MATTKKKDNRDIKALSTVEHILQRPNTYLGSTKKAEYEEWIFDDEDNLKFTKVSYVEGLKKCITEIIDNSVDEYIKTEGAYSNKINIEITKDTFTCEDNGRGIKVAKTAEGDWMPVLALCRPMSGSNFEDGGRDSIGTNGLGAKIASVFSKSFDAVTCDGKGKLKIVSKNNLSEIKVTELTPTAKTGTKVIYKPDFERFGVKGFDDTIISLVKTRLKMLGWFCPKCTFTFNGEKITFKTKDFTSIFPKPSVVVNEDNVFICVYPSDEPRTLSYVNAMSLRRCGTQVDYVMEKLVDTIREKLGKKFPSLKPADIRNRLGLVVFFNGFPDCTFDSQTKEALSNSASEYSEFLQKNQIDFDSLTNKVIKEKAILENITDLVQAKLAIADKKALKALDKKVKEVNSEKYFPPVGKTKNKYLMITEGQSAFSGISPILGRQGIGYYMLRGKPMNILDVPPLSKGKVKGFMENQEIKELVDILGLSVSGTTKDMNYEYVVILSDADADGTAIAGLIITLFSRLAPEMLKQGRICRLNTPLLIGLKGDKVEDYYFNLPNEIEMKKNLNYFYLKGLGSWTKSRLNQVIEKEGGMEKLLMPFEYDNKAQETIQNWFGNDSEPRKVALRGREFHINNA